MPYIATRPPYTLVLREDETPVSPREDFENFGNMVCWHRRYRLGDENEYETPQQFLKALVDENVRPAKVLAYVKSGRTPGLKLLYNPSARQWEIHTHCERLNEWYTEATFAPPLRGNEAAVAEALTEEMDTKALYGLLQTTKVCLLPLYLYDHSGITISTTGFACPWDSGQVGYICATPAAVQKEYGAVNPGTLQRAKTLLQSEVSTYDDYLTGNCHRFQLYQNGEEIDSCGGFLGNPEAIAGQIEACLPAECAGITQHLHYTAAEYEPEYAAA